MTNPRFPTSRATSTITQPIFPARHAISPTCNFISPDGTTTSTSRNAGSPSRRAAACIVAGGLVAACASIFATSAARAQCVPTWQPAIGQPGVQQGVSPGFVFTLHAQANGDVVVGGFFSAAGGTSGRGNIARYTPSTGVWSSVGPGFAFGSSVVWTIGALGPTGSPAALDLAVGGQFTSAGGVSSTFNLARFVNASQTFASLGNGAFSDVRCFANLPDGRLVVGGQFGRVNNGSIIANAIALLDPQSNTWTTTGQGVSGSVASVLALLVLPEGDVLVGGRFTTAGGVAGRNGIARYRPSSGTWSSLGSGVSNATGNAGVRALALLGSRVIIGGVFTNAGGVQVNGLATYDLQTDTWGSIGGVSEGGVSALAVLPDGSLIAGGFFQSVGGTPASNIARWDGASWHAMGAGVNDEVNALAVTPSGELTVGGFFTSAGGFAVNRLAMWAVPPGCSACDDIDFNNNDVFPEEQDVIDFFNVLAGGECPPCNDIDFNNNGVFPEEQDVIDFFNVLAGGVCP